MKVYIITNSPFPYGMAPVKRKICYAKALLSQGVDCKVVVFSRTEQKGKPTPNISSKGVFEGVPFEYLGGSNVRSSINLIAKLQTVYLEFYLLFYLLKKLEKGDVVLEYAHDKFTNFMNAVIRVTHLKGAKFVRELCELPFGKGKEKKSDIIARKRILTNQFPKYDGVIAISDSLVDLSRKYMGENKSILKVPILVEYEKYDMEDKSEETQQPYIFHSGTLTEQKDGLLGMIEAFGLAQSQLKRPVRFICTGNKDKSPCKKEIDVLIDKYNLGNELVFTGYLSDDELRGYLQKASVVIINKAVNQQNTYCFSTKLGEYMAAGKAIIITKVGEAMNWLTDGEDALIIPPCENDMLAEAIIRLLNDDVLHQHLGKNARKTCKQCFDYRVWGNSLKEYFETI